MEDASAVGTISLLAYTLGPLLLVGVLAYAIARNRRAKKQGPLAPGERHAGPAVGQSDRRHD
jgi:hypothetical protein